MVNVARRQACILSHSTQCADVVALISVYVSEGVSPTRFVKISRSLLLGRVVPTTAASIWTHVSPSSKVLIILRLTNYFKKLI